MNKVYTERLLPECVKQMFENSAVITSDGLNHSEFIYVCDGEAFYEDGCCLGTFSETLNLLQSQDWANLHKWYVIGYLTDVEEVIIRRLLKQLRAKGSLWYERRLNKLLSRRCYVC